MFLKYSEDNEAMVSEMEKAVGSGHYEVRWWVSRGENIHCEVQFDRGNRFLPAIYLDDYYGEDKQITVGVQTTSYGALNADEIAEFVASMQTAASVAYTIKRIAESHGYTVR